MKQFLTCLIAVMMVAMPILSFADGLLPSLEELYGVGMPSMFEYLKRMPSKVTNNTDGSSSEQYDMITDEDYQGFGVYLSNHNCEMLEYETVNSQFIATVKYNNATFSFSYDIVSHQAVITYPSGTYNAMLNKLETHYQKLSECIEAGNYIKACEILQFFKTHSYYRDVSSYTERIRRNFPKGLVAAELWSFYCLNQDGTVSCANVTATEVEAISKWRGIVSIDAGSDHLLGLKSDGTVVAYGNNDNNQCDVSKWKNIVAVSGGSNHSLGLQANGRVVAAGKGEYGNNYGQCNVSEWKSIIAISAGGSHSLGLRSNGTVVAVGKKTDGQCNVSGWKNIVAISAGSDHSVGLRKDGTVVATGENRDGQCNVSGWKNIVSIVAGNFWTIGLQADGKVLYTGYPNDLNEWSDVVNITGEGNFGLCIRIDGSIVPVEDSPIIRQLKELNAFD